MFTACYEKCSLSKTRSSVQSAPCDTTTHFLRNTVTGDAGNVRRHWKSAALKWGSSFGRLLSASKKKPNGSSFKSQRSDLPACHFQSLPLSCLLVRVQNKGLGSSSRGQLGLGGGSEKQKVRKDFGCRLFSAQRPDTFSATCGHTPVRRVYLVQSLFH